MHIYAVGMALALLLSACGGGGSGSATQATGAVAPETTVSADGRSRQVNAPCSFSQTLGTTRGDNMRIDRVSWVQTVEFNAALSSTRLIAGKLVLARIDLLANGSPATPRSAYLLVSNANAANCTRINLMGPSTVPVTRDPQTLNSAYSASIPATLIQPGTSISIVFDDAVGRTASEADEIYRVHNLPVNAALSEAIRVIPITYKGQNGSVSSNTDLAALMTRLHPVTTFNLQTEAAFAPPSLNQSVLDFFGSGQESFTTMQAVLSELDDECAKRNGPQSSARTAPKCLGVFPNNLTFRSGTSSVVGLAYVGGVSMLTQSVSATDTLAVISPYSSSHWLDFRALTVAHEYGHLLNLSHAACGGPTDNDPRLYPDGRLGGVAGYDSARNFYFSSQRLASDGQPQFGDLMSYCAKEWSSDRGYLAELSYRGAGSARVDSTSRESASSHWLKISLQQGQWQLRPVFFTPATLRITDKIMQAQTALGLLPLPVYSAVIADAPESVQGPFFVDLGELEPDQLFLQALPLGDVLINKIWSAGEWTDR
ncbi:MAG: hypothetical protein V4730_11550 [Pseudomonadota bacterium]